MLHKLYKDYILMQPTDDVIEYNGQQRATDKTLMHEVQSNNDEDGGEEAGMDAKVRFGI